MEWLKTIAPALATALGGPLAGAAATFLADKLGAGEKTVEAVNEIITGNSMTPDQVAQIKLAEIEFQKFLKTNEIDLERVHAGDRDSARKREIEVRDGTPRWLAFFITGGFFAVLAFMLANEVPESGRDALLVMLGALGTGWASVVAYYYGSSSGSAHKTAAMERLAKRG